jgi:hypothetical protein
LVRAIGEVYDEQKRLFEEPLFGKTQHQLSNRPEFIAQRANTLRSKQNLVKKDQSCDQIQRRKDSDDILCHACSNNLFISIPLFTGELQITKNICNISDDLCLDPDNV